jgi:hypothetical protein
MLERRSQLFGKLRGEVFCFPPTKTFAQRLEYSGYSILRRALGFCSGLSSIDLLLHPPKKFCVLQGIPFFGTLSSFATYPKTERAQLTAKSKMQCDRDGSSE